MIKVDLRVIGIKLVGPVIAKGTKLTLLFELNSIIKSFMEDDRKEMLHAVFAHNLKNISKQFEELDMEKFNDCIEILKEGTSHD